MGQRDEHAIRRRQTSVLDCVCVCVCVTTKLRAGIKQQRHFVCTHAQAGEGERYEIADRAKHDAWQTDTKSFVVINFKRFLSENA